MSVFYFLHSKFNAKVNRSAGDCPQLSLCDACTGLVLSAQALASCGVEMGQKEGDRGWSEIGNRKREG